MNPTLGCFSQLRAFSVLAERVNLKLAANSSQSLSDVRRIEKNKGLKKSFLLSCHRQHSAVAFMWTI